MATDTFRGAALRALLLIFALAPAAPSRAANIATTPPPAPAPAGPTVEPGVAREEIPVWTNVAPRGGRLARRPHLANPPLEEVVVFNDSLEGRPLDDEGGWTHADASGKPSAWHIDSLFSCQGKVWWCGRVDSTWIYDSNRAGYGNSWSHFLENSVRLDTIPAGTVAKIGFKHRLSVEPGYDFCRLEALDLTHGYVELARFTGKVPAHGSGCDTFTVSIPESIRVQYYADPQNPLPLYFRFVFESDVGFSSEDGLYDGDGWILDNISVTAGTQVRFFDNMEGGPKNWNYTVLPPVGDFYALQNNVTTEDICTINRSNVWVDWDPVVQSLVPRLDNLLMTPPVAVQRSDRVVVNFDVYRNLPIDACFYYHLNYRWKNVGDPAWSVWTDPTRLLYYGATKDWARQKVVLASAAGKDSVMVQLAVTDYGPVYCGGSQSGNGVYTFFDNVAIGVTATSPPILVQRDLDLFQDTFSTTPFFKDDNVNSAVGDSTVVQVSTPRGYKSGFLKYRVNGGSFTSVPLVVANAALPTLRSADVVPGSYPAGATIQYFFAVTDSQNTTAMLPYKADSLNDFFSMSVLPIKSAVNPALACFDSLAPILFVNNFAGREPRYYMAEAMTSLGYKFDEWDVNGPSSLVGNTPAGSTPGGQYAWPATDVSKLTQYKAILWYSGNLSATPIRQEDQAMIQSWIQQTGSDRNFWISGDDIANALWSGDEYNSFMSFTCGVRFIRDLWETYPQDTLHPVVTGIAGGPTSARFMHANADCPLIDDFDMIASSNSAILGGKAGLYLKYPNNLGAATRYATKYASFGTDSARCVFMGFSFSGIEEGGERLQLTTNTLHDYFGLNNCYYPTAVEDEGPGSAGAPRIPNRLYQNAPNPFNPETAIRYSVSSAGNVTIRVYNAAGALVRTLVDRVHAAGPYTVRWDGKDDSGRRLGSGVYFYEIQAAGGFRDSRKLVLLK